MAGSYTHIALVRVLYGDPKYKEFINNLPVEAKHAILKYNEFCQMGSVSPDYPYMDVRKPKEAGSYANLMHNKLSTAIKANIIHVGIEYVRELKDKEKAKCLAWLLGYMSHVIADVTCHPITNLLVGDYEGGKYKDPSNEVKHRISEIHQDIYITDKIFGETVGKSEHFAKIIGNCTEGGNRKKEGKKVIDGAIEKLWRYMLESTFPDIYKENVPDINRWHRGGQLWLVGVAEEYGFLPKSIRKAIELFFDPGVFYPPKEELDGTYIKSLLTPTGKEMHYDEIFDHAIQNIMQYWILIANATCEDEFGNFDAQYKEKIGIWDLDSGQTTASTKLMWEN